MKFFSITLSLCITATSGLRGAKVSTVETSQQSRQLQTAVSGACTVENFAAAVGGKPTLASYLGVLNNDSAMQNALDEKCEDALEPTIDLSDTLGKGPQFLKNFLDGGTTWNDNYETPTGKYSLEADAAVIPATYSESTTSSVYSAPDGGTSETYPGYFSNFYRANKECVLGVMECCYVGSRKSDVTFENNAQMCAMDLGDAAKSNHIKDHAFTFFDTQPSNQAYCSGFAFEKDTFEDSVKYNTLFHMAMKTNLYDKGYVKNIPGAPMCGCLDQMPIVDNAACVKVVEGYTIDSNGNVGVNLSWTDCGTDLKTYYDSLNRAQVEKDFVAAKIVGDGKCEDGALAFMNDLMYVKKSA